MNRIWSRKALVTGPGGSEKLEVPFVTGMHHKPRTSPPLFLKEKRGCE